MHIANPIYDVVFKYLMKDNKVAKLFLSAIIGKEIINLSFRPTELEIKIKESLTVLRIDFNARIKDKFGEEQIVVIELQKAKLPSDIMRFRRYLGEHYSNPENSREVTTKKGLTYKEGLPIISIYFLGHSLDYAESPVVKVARKCYDVATGEELARKERFIECLTHDSFIIQIPKLKNKRRNELEKLLSVFDQSSQIKANKHILNIDETTLPEQYKLVVRRLLKAMSDAQIRKTMTIEDDILADMQSYERAIAKKDKVIEKQGKALVEKDKVIEESQKELETKDKVIEAKDKALQDSLLELQKMKELLDKLKEK